MISCPCLDRNTTPELLIQAKQLRLQTEVLLNVVRESHSGVREPLRCTINSSGCTNCIERLAQANRCRFNLA